MTPKWLSGFIRLLILSPGLNSMSPGQIRVCFFASDAVPEQALETARREAERILRTTGVELQWTFYRSAESGKEGCWNTGPDTLYFRSYANQAAAGFYVPKQGLGFSVLAAPPGHGIYAGIFPARIAVLASHFGIDMGTLTGHVLAHEVGHLLMGRPGHSADGIMKIPWGAKAMRRMRDGDLLFLPEENLAIASNVQARRSASQLLVRRMVE